MKFGLFVTTISILVSRVSLKHSNYCKNPGCTLCTTQANQRWCLTCSQGHYLSTTEKGLGACLSPIEIPNCAEPAESDPTNPARCGRCKHGWYLSPNKKHCFRFVNTNCDLPYIWEGVQLCNGCKNRYLDDDYKACSKARLSLPEGCLYGDIVSSRRCLRCKEGFGLTEDRLGCETFGVKGCLRRHLLDRGKCAVCDSEMGWFSVDAVKDESGNLFQICGRYSARLKTFLPLIFLYFAIFSPFH